MDVSDSPDEDILIDFDRIYEYFINYLLIWFINEARSLGNILVHCYGGISRSSSIVIAYLMKNMNVRFENALDYVKNKKNDINPNEGFRRKLKNYENECLIKPKFWIKFEKIILINIF